MNQPRSLQRRLGIGLAIAVTGMWLVAMLVAGLIVRHELDEAFDGALQETAQRLLPLAVLDVMGREGAARHVAALRDHKEFLTYLVRDPAGRILLRSHEADPAVFPTRPATGYGSTRTHRLYGEAAITGTIIIEIAEPLAHRREAALEATAGLLAPLPILIPLSLAGVWWFVRRSMAPVLAFNAEIEARGDGNLTPLSAEALPAEIHPIAEAVNRFMDRLRRSLDAERSFAANSAHELRTPLAATLAQTQRLIAEAPEGARLISRIDPDAFAVLMRNLIENALMHGDAGEAVVITVKEAGTVSVVNGGAAVLAHKLETLKARFVRGGTHARGSGLGLAIAETIAAGAGARLDLISPATGRATGFEAVLHLSHSPSA